MAFVLAPAVPILLASALAVLAGSPSWHPVSFYVDRSDPNHPLLVDGPRFIGTPTLFAIYATRTLIGLALYLFIRRFRDVTGNVCIAGGILTGVIFMLLITDLTEPPLVGLLKNQSFKFSDLAFWSGKFLSGLLGGAVWGAIGGFAFWKLAGGRI